MGTRVHLGQEGTGPDMIAAALADVGLDPALADAADSADYDEALRASHEAGMKPVGHDVGTPVCTSRSGRRPIAFFGPVVTPIPRGDAAGTLWDGVLAVPAPMASSSSSGPATAVRSSTDRDLPATDRRARSSLAPGASGNLADLPPRSTGRSHHGSR